ncbi:hypothetical protein ACFWF5_30525, partial [Streptomyces diastaticus]
MTTDPHPAPADTPDLSVVVPADAGPEALRASAASVLEQTLRHTEAVLVDPGRDSATTRAAAALAERHPGRVRHVTAARAARLLARHGHPGLAAARERALLTDHVLP